MAVCLRHRGPDDNDVWSADHQVGFAHTRLAIVDLSAAGHQPMASVDGRYVIAYNGEIYNHLELRLALEKEGASPRWRGHADTETILACFTAWGIETTVGRLVGMFAFAVWDHHTRTLTLGRDRLGEKPLYYGRQGDAFLFGSELKALRAHPAFAGAVDDDAVASYMRFGYVPAPRSIYRGISKLPPGTLLEVGPDGVPGDPVPYWSFLDQVRAGMRDRFEGTDDEAVTELERLLGRSIQLQRMSDVPLGAFLSGGVDSSTIVALMQAGASQPVHTFTIGFEETAYDESAYAAAVARHLGTRHTALEVTEAEARGVIPRLAAIYDEPFADSSQIPTYLVSQLARREVTVSLSGDAGDELFGGYNRYRSAAAFSRIPAAARGLVASGLDLLSPGQWDSVYGAVERAVPRRMRVRNAGDKAQKLASLLSADTEPAMYRRLVSIWQDPERVVAKGRDRSDLDAMWREVSDLDSVEHRMMAIDSLTYLPDDILCKVDRAAMAVSLETRVPFLDHRVVEFAWRLPLRMKIRDGQGKWILRRLLDRHVPRALIERPKAGFAVPIDAWLRGPLKEWAGDLLSADRLLSDGYFSVPLVQQKWEEHRTGRRNWQPQLWSVLMFQSWLDDVRH